jgi:hypothetical protein
MFYFPADIIVLYPRPEMDSKTKTDPSAKKTNLPKCITTLDGMIVCSGLAALAGSAWL